MSMVMPDDDSSTVDPRIVYRAGRIAFFLAALFAAGGSVNHVLFLIASIDIHGPLPGIMRAAAWNWYVVTPLTFVGFFAGFLLLGRWREPSWLHASILFALVQTYFLAYWCIDNRDFFGWPGVPLANRGDMARLLTARALGFMAMITLGAMAFAVLPQQEKPGSEGLLNAARASCGIGFSLLVILGMRLYDPFPPWPPHFRWIADRETFQIFLAAMLARPVSGIFVCILCARASGACSRELDRVQKAMIEDDPFRSRSERP